MKRGCRMQLRSYQRATAHLKMVSLYRNTVVEAKQARQL